MFIELVSALIFGLNESSFASTDYHKDHFSHLPEGGRRGLHGMVVFGAGPYFLEHIPMLTPPHDFQIIAEVVFKKNGIELTSDFSQQGFTMKPSSNFSLNDYAAGRLRAFTASVYQGSFEKNGKLIDGLESVSVEVVSYKFVRRLPGTQTVKTVVRLTDGKNSYESNVIRPDQNFQQIRNKNTGKVLWCVKAPDFFDSCE